MDIFNWFGSLLGYLLWFLYEIVQNYGVAIILFTIVVKALVFPFSVKQQKSMASQAKVQKKVRELQKIYANDKMKLNEETQKLYQKEGVSMTGGCLPMLIPLPILFGIYYSVIYPLRNALHIDANVVNQATQMLSKIPGVSSTFASHYAEIEIIKHFDSLRDYLTMFSAGDVDKIESFSHGFKFLGLDLLATPQASSFASMMWLIPAICLVTSLLMQLVTTKMQPASASQQQQGCMKYMLYGMSSLHGLSGIHHARRRRLLLGDPERARHRPVVRHHEVLRADRSGGPLRGRPRRSPRARGGQGQGDPAQSAD